MIYCVEDERNIRELLIYTLETTGFKARGFGNGNELMKALKEEIPELILLDIMLPGDDGYTILEQLKSMPSVKDVPVIMVTAKEAEFDKVKGLEGGADDYITKPFNFEILMLRIRKLMERREAAREAFRQQIEVKPSDITITSLDEKLIQKAIKYVEDNISSSELSVEELSKSLGMSRVHLYKKLLSILVFLVLLNLL